MLFNFQSNKLRKHLLVGSAVCAATLGFFGCTPDYNLDEDQPTGLNTIYGYMEDQGNYKNFLRLIDDLGEKATLSKTGSKTLFIADDDATILQQLVCCRVYKVLLKANVCVVLHLFRLMTPSWL